MPLYNTLNILKLYFFPILFKYSFLIIFFTISLPFPLFLPQPLALASTSSKPILTTMATLYYHHELDHPNPWPKPITKITRPSTPCRSHKQTTSHKAKTTHTHSQKPSPKLLDHQPQANLISCHHHHQQNHYCTICHPSKIITKNPYQNHLNQTSKSQQI